MQFVYPALPRSPRPNESVEKRPVSRASRRAREKVATASGKRSAASRGEGARVESQRNHFHQVTIVVAGYAVMQWAPFQFQRPTTVYRSRIRPLGVFESVS